VAVEVGACPVIAHRGSRVGVSGGEAPIAGRPIDRLPDSGRKRYKRDL
jgi:hypothetical protein